MKTAVVFRRFLCLLLVPLFLIPAALADVPDISSLTDDEIVELLGKVNQEVVTRGIEKSAELPVGKYTAGKDFPAGSYILYCKTDASHHGIVWVSAPEDDLDKEYPSILYKHVGLDSEEQFRFTIEEGGILNLPIAATLTISSGLKFK